MELGTLIQYFKADLTHFDAGLNRADSRMNATQKTFNSIINDITGNVSNRFGASGRYVNEFVNEIVTGGDRSAQASQKIRGELKSLEDQAQRVKNRFSDFSEGLRIAFGGKVDAGFLRQFREAQSEGEKFSLLTKRFGGDAATMFSTVEKSAFQFSKLERDGTRALSAIEGKAKSLTTELSVIEQGAGSALSAFGGPAGIALAAMAAVTAATIGLGLATFKLTKETAAHAAGLYDLSQKSGISVETLSALKLVNETTGTSIEGTNSSLVRYLKSVSDVNHGNTELAKKFTQVGFTAKDLTDAYKSEDDAVRILIDRVGALSSAEDRNNALTKIGVRNGQDLNGIITEINSSYGSYLGLVKEAQALGFIITPEQAKQADAFDDSLRILELQLKALAYTGGREFMDDFTGAVQTASRYIKENRQTIEEWVDGFGDAARGAYGLVSAIGQLSGAITGLNSLSTDNDLLRFLWNINPAGIAANSVLNYGKSQRSGQDTGNIVDAGNAEATTFRNYGGRELGDKVGGGGGGSSESAARRAARQALEGMKLDQRDYEDFIAHKLNAERRSYDEGLKGLKDYNDRRTQLENDRYKKEKEILNAERAFTANPANKFGPGERELKTTEIDNQLAAAQRKHEDTLASIKAEGKQKRLDLDRSYAEREISIQQSANQALEKAQEDAVRQGLTTFEAAENVRFNAERDIFAKRQQLIIEDLARYEKGDQDKFKQAQQAERDLANEQEAATQEHNRRLHQARVDDLEDAQRYSQQLRAIGAETVSINQQTLEIQLRALEGNSFHRRELIELEARLEHGREAERSRLAMAGLADRRKHIEVEIEDEKERARLIAEIDKQIAAEKRLSAAVEADIERERQEKILEKWREISQDISGILSDAIDAGIEGGAKAGLASLAESVADTLKQIEREILNSALYALITGENKGSDAGGIVGAITNKLLGIIGLGPNGGEDGNAQAVTFNTTATEHNTLAIQQLTLALQTAGAASAAASVGGSLGGGLLKSLVGSLFSSFTGGIGGDIFQAFPWATSATDLSGLSLTPRALGGPVNAGDLYKVNENGTEYFKPDVDGQIIPLGSPQAQQGGNTTINNINVTVPMKKASSYNQKKGSRAFAEAIAGVLPK